MRISRNSPKIKISISGKVTPGDPSAGRWSYFADNFNDICLKLYTFHEENPHVIGINVTINLPKLDGNSGRGSK